MQKLGKYINEWAKGLIKVLPVGWVLACCDIGADNLFKRPLHDLFVLFCGCLFAAGLQYLGESFDKVREERGTSPVLICLMLFALLFLVTLVYLGAVSSMPNNVI